MSTVTALNHFAVSKVQRSAGRSAVKAAAYRSGERLHDDRNGGWHDYRARDAQDIADQWIRTPEGAEWADDRPLLWNAAEAREVRSNSVTAREYLVALPSELDAAQRRELVDAFATHLVDRYGIAVDVCLHNPSRDGDQRNHHAHLLTTTRRVDASGLTEKTRELDDKVSGPQEILGLRQRLSDLTNDALERARVERRVDPRSHRERGLEEAPQRKDGPAVTYVRREVEKALTEGGESGVAARAKAPEEGRAPAQQRRTTQQARTALIAELEEWVGGAERWVAEQKARLREIAERSVQVVRKGAEDAWEGLGRAAGAILGERDRERREVEAKAAKAAEAARKNERRAASQRATAASEQEGRARDWKDLHRARWRADPLPAGQAQRREAEAFGKIDEARARSTLKALTPEQARQVSAWRALPAQERGGGAPPRRGPGRER